MQGKTRAIFAAMMTGIIVFVVSGVVTFLNIGLRADYVPRWMRAFSVGWPVAAVVGFFAIPVVRALTELLVARIEGKR